MSDQKQLIVRWFEEVWNQGRRDVIDEMMAPDCILHDGDTESRGPAGFKVFYDRLRAAFSDMRITPGQAVSEGEFACLNWSVTMRHTGDGLGIPPTGKHLRTTGMSMVRFKDGRFAEAWQNWDMFGLMQQIQQTDQAPAPLYITNPAG